MRRVVLKINVPCYLLRTEPLLLLHHQEHEITCLLFRWTVLLPLISSHVLKQKWLFHTNVLSLYSKSAVFQWEPFLNSTWAQIVPFVFQLLTRFISHCINILMLSRCWRWKFVCQQLLSNFDSTPTVEPHFINRNFFVDLVLQQQIESIILLE